MCEIVTVWLVLFLGRGGDIMAADGFAMRNNKMLVFLPV